jgi:hypothetical protein
MDIPASIQQVVDKANALKAEMKTIGVESFKEMLTGIFSRHPTLMSLRWSQYTPHFNDGDPCTFNVNDIEAEFIAGTLLAKKFDKSKDWPTEDESAQEGEFYVSWNFSKQHADLSKEIGEIGNVFSTVEDLMLTVFGDGVQVTVTRDGEIEIEDYDHD